MKTMKLGKSDLEIPVIGVGCMRLMGLDNLTAERYLRIAVESGVNFFDHADIYSNGQCEEFFAETIHMNETIREKIILQSKCGIIRGKQYNFSKQYILDSVDGILKRLKTDYLDVLLLHRPDALVEPEEVAETFDILSESKKVLNFGVSNHNPTQIQLLQKFVKQPIVANQMQFSIINSTMVSSGINVNRLNEEALIRDGGILDYCRINDITIQPWSPFQFGFNEGVFLENEKFPELNLKINEIAQKYNVSNITISIAWILRHPAHMQPIVGTMNEKRLLECVKAAEIELSREEWYEIYRAAGNVLP